MERIPFKVSARTAMLIGRENIASAKGAIIELVKNSYDADSDVCLLFFDNKYAELPKKLSIKEYNFLLKKGVDEVKINSAYDKQKNKYVLKEDLEKELKRELKNIFGKLNSLYIIDNGDGMTSDVIKDYWMTIGTDNKSKNSVTSRSRVKTGEKGIGRFALDKLGNECEMSTKPKDDESTNQFGNIWKVKWSDFDGDFKTINEVTANLSKNIEINLENQIQLLISNTTISKALKPFDFSSGTFLKITNLRDDWNAINIKEVFNDLEVLVPPKGDLSFNIILYSSLEPTEYGEIEDSVSDDYDYKLQVFAKTPQEVKIDVYRREFDAEAIDSNMFNQKFFCEDIYTRKFFEKKYFTVIKTFDELVAGYNHEDKESIFKSIGPFSFSLYFLKRSYRSIDKKIYNYKSFNSYKRKKWLEKFGGIKIFRDNFRVRPYGEANSGSFDWLGLGARKAKSPATFSQKGGGYRVPPEVVSGSIHISRKNNLRFSDKSSREGLIENQSFSVFKQLIIGVIAVFEHDRAAIGENMKAYYIDKNFDNETRLRAEKVAERYIKQSISKIAGKQKKQKKSKEETILLAHLVEDKTEEINQLKDEQKLLRILASSGIVTASFAHELHNLRNILNTRTNDLKGMLDRTVSSELLKGIHEAFNPYEHIKIMRDQDKKIKSWFDFAIGTVAKDKRKRKKINFARYMKTLTKTWNTIFNERQITLKLSNNSKEEISIRAFEIDLDSIFYNLIVNSIHAFDKRTRTIEVNIRQDNKIITIDYYDNGVGLSKDVDEPEKIFNPLFTTKRNENTGEETGTGLGLWIVKSIVKEYDGSIKLLNPNSGFGLRLSFPRKFVRS